MNAVRSMLDRTPPEIRKAIYQNGIYLTGGIANMSGLDAYVESMTKIHTTAAENPGICAVNGLKKIMLSKYSIPCRRIISLSLILSVPPKSFTTIKPLASTK